jgi:hypothetical protein
MFDRPIHADWSMSQSKRWAATAERRPGGWITEAPALVGPADTFLNNAFAAAAQQRVLLGFDFPIGVPVAYGAQTGFRGFRELLPIDRSACFPQNFPPPPSTKPIASGFESAVPAATQDSWC